MATPKKPTIISSDILKFVIEGNGARITIQIDMLEDNDYERIDALKRALRTIDNAIYNFDEDDENV